MLLKAFHKDTERGQILRVYSTDKPGLVKTNVTIRLVAAIVATVFFIVALIGLIAGSKEIFMACAVIVGISVVVSKVFIPWRGMTHEVDYRPKAESVYPLYLGDVEYLIDQAPKVLRKDIVRHLKVIVMDEYGSPTWVNAYYALKNYYSAMEMIQKGYASDTYVYPEAISAEYLRSSCTMSLPAGTGTDDSQIS